MPVWPAIHGNIAVEIAFDVLACLINESIRLIFWPENKPISSGQQNPDMSPGFKDITRASFLYFVFTIFPDVTVGIGVSGDRAGRKQERRRQNTDYESKNWEFHGASTGFTLSFRILAELVRVEVIAEYDLAVVFLPDLVENRLLRRAPEQYMVQN